MRFRRQPQRNSLHYATGHRLKPEKIHAADAQASPAAIRRCPLGSGEAGYQTAAMKKRQKAKTIRIVETGAFIMHLTPYDAPPALGEQAEIVCGGTACAGEPVRARSLRESPRGENSSTRPGAVV